MDNKVNITVCLGSSCYARGNEEHLNFIEDYIEKYAREVLGYHKNGELVFVDGEK